MWRALIGCWIEAGESLDQACEELHKWAGIVLTGDNPVSRLAMAAFVEALPVSVSQKMSVVWPGRFS